MRRVSAAVVAVVLSVLVGLGAVPARAADPAPVRIALLGDSITHGTAGDWTWRYFAWKHLVADGVDADLVGPEDDLWEHNQAYADPGFDRDHAAHFGDAYAWLSHPVPQLMAEQHPDVLVVLMGLNDLTFAQLSPQQVLDETRTVVDQARAANPSVKLVISHLTATWIQGVTAYNALLDAAAPGWSTTASPLVVADSDAGFTRSTAGVVRDTWDDVHPDASGEVKIAAAMSDALAVLGIGSVYPRPLASPPLGPRTAPVLAGTPGDRALDLTWTSPPGATTERVWLRDLTAGTPEKLLREVGGTATRVAGLVDGHEYAVSLQAVKGLVPAAGIRSATLRMRPVSTRPATPAHLVVRPADHGALLSWSATTGATGYRVWRRNLSAGSGWTASAAAETTARVRGLEAGARYAVRVQAVNASGTTSTLSVPAYVVPRGPVVAAARWIRARATRSGVATLHWTAVARATRYVVYRRDVVRHGAWQAISTGRPLTSTTLRVGGQRRGTTYAFVVRALHQRVLGGTSAVARVRVPR